MCKGMDVIKGQHTAKFHQLFKKCLLEIIESEKEMICV